MKYKIDPELKHIAKRVPFHKLLILCANMFQVISFRLTKIPKKITHKRILINGYQGLTYNVELWEPSNEKTKLPCLIYVHGGAFAYKASSHHKKLACNYALEANCKVFFPDYHLIPKYPYPAAYEDVLALYRFVMDHALEYGIDKDNIGLAGDSAGASIAALIANNYKQENLVQPCLQMLIYPLADIDMQTDSMKKFFDTPLWNSKNNQRMWSYYCKDLDKKAVYGASPMHCILPAVIPDTYIETAEFDCLHDEGIHYGVKLQAAGANVEINDTRGTIHGYDSALHTRIAACNIEKRILFLKKGFYGDHSVSKDE